MLVQVVGDPVASYAGAIGGLDRLQSANGALEFVRGVGEGGLPPRADASGPLRAGEVAGHRVAQQPGRKHARRQHA
jgi:hypothetical protein